MFFRKAILKNFTNFTLKDMCWSLFVIKLQASGLNVWNIIKKRLQQQCLLVKFAKCFRTPFLPIVAASEKKNKINEHYQRSIQQISKMKVFTKTVSRFEPFSIFAKKTLS